MTPRPPKPPDRESSPPFRTRGPKNDPSPKQPRDLDLIIRELKAQSDRGAAIIAASLLEQLLEDAIVARFRPLLKGQKELLFGPMRPLSSFSAKIELGYAIGLYGEVAHKNFDMIRDVRNKFAHVFDVLSFDHPDVVELVNDPVRRRLTESPTFGTPREEFVLAFAMLGALLTAIPFAGVQLPDIGQTHGHLLQAMSAALDEARRIQAERQQAARQEKGEPEQQ
jgi:hypothetical protein